MPLLRHTGVAIYASCAQTCNTSPDLVCVIFFPQCQGWQNLTP